MSEASTSTGEYSDYRAYIQFVKSHRNVAVTRGQLETKRSAALAYLYRKIIRTNASLEKTGRKRQKYTRLIDESEQALRALLEALRAGQRQQALQLQVQISEQANTQANADLRAAIDSVQEVIDRLDALKKSAIDASIERTRKYEEFVFNLVL